MDCNSGRSGDGDSGLKEEKRSEHSNIGDDKSHHHKEIIVEVKINSILSYSFIKCHF